eukprot:XP_001706235.1 Hypothetical protein GL50803_29619 [Giardia lamblia ATCC 50803]
MCLCVHGLKSKRLDLGGYVLREALPVGLLILRFELCHVVPYVLPHDTIPQSRGVKAILRVAWKALHTVGDVQSGIDGTLHGCEDASTRASTGKPNVKERLEGVDLLVFVLVRVIFFPCRLV